jgi:hypothetical protein
MKTTAKWQVILGLLAVVAMAGGAQAAQAAPASPAAGLNFTIHVHNYAGVVSKILAEAEKTASRIFQRAGVVSRWADAPLPGQDSYNSADQRVVGLSDIWMNILPVAMYGRLNLAASVTGLAPGAGPDRVLAYIFFDRVEDMRQEQLAAFHRKDIEFPSTVADLLGSAMAHEVGHILLNLAVHSQSGIMRGNWDPGVLNDITRRCLYFTKGQETIMQSEVARRLRTQELLATVAAPGASF